MKATTASQATTLENIPNIGKAMAQDLRRLGLFQPADLIGQDPYQLYQQLCQLTAARHDPCVLDTFMAIVCFMEGALPHPWWHYTAERKRRWPTL